AGGAQDVLGAQLVRQLEGGAGAVGVEDELDDPGAVAQVDEDQPAVIAAAMDPAGDPRLRIDPIGQDLAAPGVPVFVGAQGRRMRAEFLSEGGAFTHARLGEFLRLDRLAHDFSPVISSTRLPGSTARCSPDSMSRSWALPSGSRMRVRRAPIRLACLSW